MKKYLPFVIAASAIVLLLAATFYFSGRDQIDDRALAVDRASGDQGLVEPDRVLAMPSSSSRRPLAPGDRRARMEESIAKRQEMRAAYIKRTEESRRNAVETFNSERVDPQWAPQKEVELGKIAKQSAFETAGVAPTDLRMDCKSSMCRIDGSFTSSGQAEDWVLLYMSSVGSALPNSIVSRTQNPDGTTSIQVYGRAR